MQTDELIRLALAAISGPSIWKLIEVIIANHASRRAGISAAKNQAETTASAEWRAIAAERAAEKRELQALADDRDDRLVAKARTVARMSSHIGDLEQQIRQLGGSPPPRPVDL